MKQILKGRYTPKFPEKYKGNVRNIIFRSSWELRFFKFLDFNSSVLEWASEEIAIPYTSPFDGKMHRYFIDIYAKVKSKSGKIEQYLIEIKPKKQTLPPKANSKNRLFEQKTFILNQTKWKYADSFAKKNGLKFLIFTEETLFPTHHK